MKNLREKDECRCHRMSLKSWFWTECGQWIETWRLTPAVKRKSLSLVIFCEDDILLFLPKSLDILV
jgi:hypothetical protein